jgi:hypothetical protein
MNLISEKKNQLGFASLRTTRWKVKWYKKAAKYHHCTVISLPVTDPNSARLQIVVILVVIVTPTMSPDADERVI